MLDFDTTIQIATPNLLYVSISRFIHQKSVKILLKNAIYLFLLSQTYLLYYCVLIGFIFIKVSKSSKGQMLNFLHILLTWFMSIYHQFLFILFIYSKIFIVYITYLILSSFWLLGLKLFNILSFAKSLIASDVINNLLLKNRMELIFLNLQY